MAQAAAFFFGLLIGSFLNVCIWRMPRNQSIAWPGSHCPSCNKPLRWFDNIPIFSYLFLRGKCRFCAIRIPARYPIVELLGGLSGLAAFTFWTGPYAFAAALILWALIVVIWVDWEHMIILDEISVGGAVLGVVFSFFCPAWVAGPEGAAGWSAAGRSLVGLLVGGGILYVMAIVGELIYKKEAMGGGDVKLLAAIGAFFGWQGALFTLFAGSLAGSFVGIFAKWVLKKEEIPFGPYLALGVVLHMFWGQPILSWYMARMLQY